MVDQVFTLLNRLRADNGVSPLSYDVELEAAVQGHCIHMQTHSYRVRVGETVGGQLFGD